MKNILSIILFLLPALACFGKGLPTRERQEMAVYDSIKRMMQDASIPLSDRCCLADDLELLTREHRIELCRVLLPEARRCNDKGLVTRLLSQMGLLYSDNLQLEPAKACLDSALVYEPEITDLNLLGLLHRAAGQVYLLARQTARAHQHYYKALDFFETNGTKSPVMNDITYALASCYVAQKDLGKLPVILKRMERYADKMETTYAHMLLNSAKAGYYEVLYEKENGRADYLDSMRVLNTRSIDLYHNGRKRLQAETYQLAYNYMHLGKYCLYRSEPHYSDSIVFYVKRAMEWGNPDDLNLAAHCHGLCGHYYLKRKEWSRAEGEFDKQLQVLLTSPFEELFEIQRVYGTLSYIYEQKGELKKALEAERKCSQYEAGLHNRSLNDTVQKLQVEFEVAKKEQAIAQLKEEALFQRYIRQMYGGIAILLIIILLLLLYRYRQKRREAADQLYIQQMEKEEAKLLAEIREEQAHNAELKQYEALTELKVKGLEIAGKDVELDSLKREKVKLDKQLAVYTGIIRKLQAVETGKENDEQVKPIKNDLRKIIERVTLKNGNARLYLERMASVNDRFLAGLEQQAGERIPFLSIKHCLAFAIEMATEDFATCFDVEAKSVHQIRYRLKQRLRLGKNDDLDLFLQSLID